VFQFFIPRENGYLKTFALNAYNHNLTFTGTYNLYENSTLISSKTVSIPADQSSPIFFPYNPYEIFLKKNVSYKFELLIPSGPPFNFNIVQNLTNTIYPDGSSQPSIFGSNPPYSNKFYVEVYPKIDCLSDLNCGNITATNLTTSNFITSNIIASAFKVSSGITETVPSLGYQIDGIDISCILS
jgi:hypothetical protein